MAGKDENLLSFDMERFLSGIVQAITAANGNPRLTDEFVSYFQYAGIVMDDRTHSEAIGHGAIKRFLHKFFSTCSIDIPTDTVPAFNGSVCQLQAFVNDLPVEFLFHLYATAQENGRGKSSTVAKRRRPSILKVSKCPCHL